MNKIFEYSMESKLSILFTPFLYAQIKQIFEQTAMMQPVCNQRMQLKMHMFWFSLVAMAYPACHSVFCAIDPGHVCSAMSRCVHRLQADHSFPLRRCSKPPLVPDQCRPIA